MGSATTPTTLAIPLTGTTYTLGYNELVGATLLSSVIPADDSIPQISEGTQILTVTVTPNFVGSRISVVVQTIITESTNVANMLTAALFKDGGANAVRTTLTTLSPSDNLTQGQLFIKYRLTTASLNPIVFAVRAGPDIGTCYLNQASTKTGANLMTSYIEVTEVK